MKIAINGFGRLGRAIARAALAREIEIIGVNDITNCQNLAYLLEKDSVHGELGYGVEYADGALVLSRENGSINSSAHPESKAPAQNRTNTPLPKPIPIFSCADPLELDFGAADVVIESSGHFLSSDEVAHHLAKGAKRVIISAPAADDTPTFVLGVNHAAYAGQPIISNASCTTNCLAPIAMLLDREFGIERAIITTIHSYTNDQSLLDVAHRSDRRRSRAAGLNIIPTSTGAAKALYKVLPAMQGKIHGHSVRVPVADVSMLDCNALLKRNVDERTITELFVAESSGALAGILGVDSRYGVSSDFYNDTRSAIVAQDLTFCLGDMCKIMAWYDNEWGYAHRILDMAAHILR